MSYAELSRVASFRPLGLWPGQRTARPQRSRFGASWSNTVALLARELRFLGARRTVIELAMSDADFRIDGLPRASARAVHPGVVISIPESRFGPLRYPCDRYDVWEDNVRAIALSLEALRAVDRYGVTKRGEQYVGWKALASGGPSADRGRDLIRQHGGVRQALLATHPDQGGDPSDFADVQAAREAGA